MMGVRLKLGDATMSFGRAPFDVLVWIKSRREVREMRQE
jgi:hypothetical protein